MAEFLAITFDTADQAEAALRSIRALQSSGQIGLEDTAVVRKDADGKVTIHNEASSGTETGAVVGAVLGGLLFVVFPVAARRRRRGRRRPGRPGRGARDRRRVRQGGRRRPAGRRLRAVPPDQERRQPGPAGRGPAPVSRAGPPDLAATTRSRPRWTSRCAESGPRPGPWPTDHRPARSAASRIIGVPWPTDRATTSRPRSPTRTTSRACTRSTRSSGPTRSPAGTGWLGDDTRFLTGTDEHSINIAQAALDEGRPTRDFVDEKVAMFKTAEDALGDRARPVHPDDRSGPRPGGPGDGPPRSCQRRHLPRDVRGLVLPERGVPQRDRRRRDRARHDLPEPSRGAAPVADRAELVLPAVGLPGAPRAPLRRAPRLRPARVPAQRDARLHPRRSRGLLDQSRADARRLGDPVPDRRERRDGTARGRFVGSRRPARSTSGTTRSSTTSRAPASPTTARRSTTGGRPTCTSSARTSPGSTRSSGRPCCGAPGSRRRARSGSTAGCWRPAANG